jgi:D-glycero-alpha-D-manno-heptose-7-phosphate kinase
VIVTRTPLRIPLGGGGTDLPSYYRSYGGFFVSAAINKYIYITVNARFEDSIRVSYSRTEIVDCVEEIEHPIVRKALQLLGLGTGLEIISMADLPSNTGLGSSGSFTVGLLQALHSYRRESVSAQQIAEEAFHIEAELLGEPVGKQDQYVAAFGRVTAFQIACDGSVKATPINLRDEVLEQLENDSMLFYTGLKRSAGEVLGSQQKALAQHEGQITESLHQIKAIGHEVVSCLQDGNLTRFGELLDEHWQAKKRTSSLITTSEVDRWYDLARAEGVLGGKLMGAGGGGFLMLYCPNNHKAGLRKAMTAEGLKEMRFAIDQDGSKVIVNL